MLTSGPVRKKLRLVGERYVPVFNSQEGRGSPDIRSPMAQAEGPVMPDSGLAPPVHPKPRVAPKIHP